MTAVAVDEPTTAARPVVQYFNARDIPPEPEHMFAARTADGVSITIPPVSYWREFRRAAVDSLVLCGLIYVAFAGGLVTVSPADVAFAVSVPGVIMLLVFSGMLVLWAVVALRTSRRWIVIDVAAGGRVLLMINGVGEPADGWAATEIVAVRAGWLGVKLTRRAGRPGWICYGTARQRRDIAGILRQALGVPEA
jgi:hypothetical protein